MVELVKGGVFSFNTINGSLLGATYEKARVSAVAEYATAKIIDPTIDSTQAALIPYLPAGASTKHTAYTYFVIVTQTGQTKVFAKEWINPSSVTANNTQYVDIRVSGASSSDLAAIRQALSLAGWPVVNEIV